MVFIILAGIPVYQYFASKRKIAEL